MAGEEEQPPRLVDYGDSIDKDTFEQILEMDDDDDEREFSKGIVYGFFDQARSTFKKMDDALREEDLETLSSLGHFLKGSSATLGLTNVRQSCEKIQHLGHLKDETGEREEDSKYCLSKIKRELDVLKVYYAEAEVVLKRFYEAS